MTTMCLSDEMLLAVRMGDAAPEDARHATGCVLCARRLARLRADLARIDEIFALPPPSRRGRAVPARFAPELIVPLAAAAMLTLVVATRWFAPTPVAGDDDVTAVLADVNAAFATASSDADADDDTPGAIDVAFGARSTCGLDEPFIGVGCNDDSLVLAAVER